MKAFAKLSLWLSHNYDHSNTIRQTKWKRLKKYSFHFNLTSCLMPLFLLLNQPCINFNTISSLTQNVTNKWKQKESFLRICMKKSSSFFHRILLLPHKKNITLNENCCSSYKFHSLPLCMFQQNYKEKLYLLLTFW